MIWVISMYNLDMRLAIGNRLRHINFIIFGLEDYFMMILAMRHSSREQTLLPNGMIGGRNTQLVWLEGRAHLSKSSIVALDFSAHGRFLID